MEEGSFMTVNRRAEARRLLQDRGHLVRLEKEGSDWYWYVPSRRILGLEYRLPYEAESCPCPDHEMRRATCAHMIAVAIVKVDRLRWWRAREKVDSLSENRPRGEDLERIAKRLGV